MRPLVAHVSQHNIASFRVLEKCGFTKVGEDKEFSHVGGKLVEGFILKLMQLLCGAAQRRRQSLL